MVTVKIKPLSVNECWQGKRFKTMKYKIYEAEMLWMLPKMELPEPPYEVHFVFGFSNYASDIDNPVKITMDILQKKYGFNDRDVIKMFLEKVKVKKGDEFIKYSISHLSNGKS